MLTRRHFIATSAAALGVAPFAVSAQDAPIKLPTIDQLATLPAGLAPRVVALSRPLPAGQIHVVPDTYSLYWTLPDSRAIRYFVGVGRDTLYEPGIYVIRAKKEWPSWTPTPDMIERQPELYKQHEDGMPGGPGNPLGARAVSVPRQPRHLSADSRHQPAQHDRQGCVERLRTSGRPSGCRPLQPRAEGNDGLYVRKRHPRSGGLIRRRVTRTRTGPQARFFVE